MAGMGKRMRPHTLVTPKPLLKVAGIALVERIVNDLIKNTGKKVEEIHYIIGNFGEKTEKKLFNIAENVDAKGYIHYQKEALGTAHAIICSEEALKGEVIIAFADTMFIGNMNISNEDEAVIWTLSVKNPENYGVVLTDSNNVIVDFIEKPKDKISDKAIIGIYYFRRAELLKTQINELIQNNKTVKGEYQLTDALQNMMKDGIMFKCKEIDKWLDYGNKNEFLKSMAIVLQNEYNNNVWAETENKIINPVCIGKNVKIENSVIGPFVSIEENSIVINSQINNSIIGNDTIIDRSNINNSIIGNYNKISNAKGILNIGDYSEYEGS